VLGFGCWILSLPFFPPPAFAQAASVPAIRCLTPDGGRQPSFFPDGKRIVYVHETSEGQEHLMILDLATGKATRVGKIDGADHPTVSPDGKWIAYAAGPIFARQIWVVEVATGKARQLTTGFAGRGSPNWADGGRKILFSLSKEKKQSWTKLDPFKSPPAAEELKPLGPGRVTVSASGKLFALVTTDERGSNHLRILRPNGSTVAEMSFASGSASSAHKMVDPRRFYRNTRSDKISTTARPFRPDEFILMSAGWDSEYGTADDICNYEWKYRE